MNVSGENLFVLIVTLIYFASMNLKVDPPLYIYRIVITDKKFKTISYLVKKSKQECQNMKNHM